MIIGTMSQVYKHVFLDFQEYQRLLEAKRRSEILAVKVKELERKVAELKDGRQEGTGSLAGMLARKQRRDELEEPFSEIIDSITMPSSANLGETQHTQNGEKWYYLGKPGGK